MSEESVTPMNAELRALLRQGAPPLEAPSGMEAKLLARLGESIPSLGDPPGGGGGGGGGGTATAVGMSTGVKAAIAIGVASVALAGVAVFGAGGKSDTVAVRAPVVTTIAASQPLAAPPPAASSDVPTMNIDSLPSAPLARASAVAPAPSAASDPTQEHALLDEARNAVGRGDNDAALAAVERHQAQFPRGALIEEREVLAIRALAAAGRTNEANARAARFKARHPQSLFLPAIDAALAH